MPSSCCAFGCTYRKRKGDNVGFFSFPSDPIKRQLWIYAIRRKNWTPSYASRLCGKHFQTGKPSKDENHPDYVPNIFIFSQNKHTTDEQRKITQEKVSQNGIFSCTSSDITSLRQLKPRPQENCNPKVPISRYKRPIKGFTNPAENVCRSNIFEKKMKVDFNNNQNILIQNGATPSLPQRFWILNVVPAEKKSEISAENATEVENRTTSISSVSKTKQTRMKRRRISISSNEVSENDEDLYENVNSMLEGGENNLTHTTETSSVTCDNTRPLNEKSSMVISDDSTLSVESFVSASDDSTLTAESSIRAVDILHNAEPSIVVSENSTVLDAQPSVTATENAALLSTEPPVTVTKNAALLDAEPSITSNKNSAVFIIKPLVTANKNAAFLYTEPSIVASKNSAVFNVEPSVAITGCKNLTVLNVNPPLAVKENAASLNINSVKCSSENMTKFKLNNTIAPAIKPVKDTDDYDYSYFKSTPLDTKEILAIKLETMLAVNMALQEKVKFYRNRCKLYKGEINKLTSKRKFKTNPVRHSS